MIFSSILLLLSALRVSFKRFFKDDLRRAFAKALILLLSGALLSSGISLYVHEIKRAPYEELIEKGYVSFHGEVLHVIWSESYGGFYEVRVTDADGLGQFKCILSATGGLEEGDIINGHADFCHFEENPQFDEERYYLSKGIICRAEAKDVSYTGKAQPSFISVAQGTNRYLSDIFHKFLPEDSAGFASAILLGNKDGLDPFVSRDFGRLGLSHILAISGMHLSILCAYISLIVRPFGKNASRAAGVLTVLFYMFITGFAASVTRSGIMLLCLMGGEMLRRRTDRFTNLGIAVFLICLIDPYSAGDIGLQLSFTAVFAILLYTEKRRQLTLENADLKSRPRIINYFLSFARSLGEAALLTVIIVLFMLPLEWLYFGQISLISPLTSPVFSLLCTLLLWLLPIILLFSPIAPIASLISVPCDLLISFVCHLAERLSRLRGIVLSLEYPLAPYFCILIFFCVLIFCVAKKKKRLIFGAVTIAVFAVFLLSCFIYHVPYYENSTVAMLSVNKNDGIYLVSDNRAMIIDMSDGRTSLTKEGLNAMKISAQTEIEVLMLTHVHSYHASTIYSVSEDYIIRTLLLPDTDSKHLDAVMDAAINNGIQVRLYKEGDTLTFGDAEIRTFENTFIKRSVQPIIRLDITQRGETLTYLGAAYMEAYPDESFHCDHLYFGGHGPLYKAEFTVNTRSDCKIYASETAFDYIVGENTQKLSEVIILGD